MSIIQIDCPVCGQALELDSGFAGGVCRCSACGALMTVPKQTGEKAEKLTRPDSPPMSFDAPELELSQRPETPHHSIDTAAATLPDSADPAADERPEYPPASPFGSEHHPIHVLATASGRLITIVEQRIPIAHRSRHRAVWITSILAIAAVIAWAFAAMMIFNGLTKNRPVDPNIGFGFDVNTNPLFLDAPNFLGLPMDQPTVLLLDKSPASVQVMPMLERYLSVAAMRWTDNVSCQLVFNSDLQPILHPQSLRLWTAADVIELRRQLAELPVVKQSSLWMAMDMAVRSRPHRVILVTNQSLPRSELEQLVYSLDQSPNLRLDVVCIGVDRPELRAQAQQRRGQYVCIPPVRLASWMPPVSSPAAESSPAAGPSVE